MKKFFTIAAVLACTSVHAEAATVNYTLDFDTGGVCTNQILHYVPDGTLTACDASRSLVGLTYGDQPGVDVEWRRNVDEGTEGRLNVYQGFYNQGLVDAFASVPSNLHTASIIFRALDGATVGLLGFEFVSSDFVTILGNNESTFTISDLDPNGFGPITQAIASTTNQLDREPFSFAGLTSAVGIELRFGRDGSTFGWGIDNIAYSVTPSGSTTPPNPSAVPLPASALLLLAGLGGLSALRRRAA